MNAFWASETADHATAATLEGMRLSATMRRGDGRTECIMNAFQAYKSAHCTHTASSRWGGIDQEPGKQIELWFLDGLFLFGP